MLRLIDPVRRNVSGQSLLSCVFLKNAYHFLKTHTVSDGKKKNRERLSAGCSQFRTVENFSSHSHDAMKGGKPFN